MLTKILHYFFYHFACHFLIDEHRTYIDSCHRNFSRKSNLNEYMYQPLIVACFLPLSPLRNGLGVSNHSASPPFRRRRGIDLRGVSMIEFARNATVSGDSGTVAGVALSSVIDLYALPLMSVRRFDSDVRDERGMVCVHARSSYRRRHHASRSQNNVIATRLVRLDRWIGTFRGLVAVYFYKIFYTSVCISGRVKER